MLDSLGGEMGTDAPDIDSGSIKLQRETFKYYLVVNSEYI